MSGGLCEGLKTKFNFVWPTAPTFDNSVKWKVAKLILFLNAPKSTVFFSLLSRVRTDMCSVKAICAFCSLEFSIKNSFLFNASFYLSFRWKIILLKTQVNIIWIIPPPHYIRHVSILIFHRFLSLPHKKKKTNYATSVSFSQNITRQKSWKGKKYITDEEVILFSRLAFVKDLK